VALLSRQPKSSDIRIPDLRSDPRLAPAAELLAAFRAKAEQLICKRKRLVLERLLADRAPDPRSSDDVTFRMQLAALRAEETPSPAAPTDPGIAPSKVALDALAVVRDLPFTPPPTHEGQMAIIDRQLAALDAGIREQTEAVAQITGEITYEISKTLKPVWDEIELARYHAAEEVSRAERRAREFVAKLIAAGITPRSDVMGSFNARGPLMTGSESDWGSEISMWRRFLEQKGILS
jgi:hypothetical protein